MYEIFKDMIIIEKQEHYDIRPKPYSGKIVITDLNKAKAKMNTWKAYIVKQTYTP